MPTPSSLWAFAALAFALVVVPGPSVMFVVSRAITFGRRTALLTVAGNAAGVFAQVALVAIGLGVIVERSVAVFTAIKLLGAGYLVWLGVQAIRHRRRLTDVVLDAEATGPVGSAQLAGLGTRSAVRDGFVVGVANPKAIVFFAAILPQYVSPQGAPAQLQMLALGLVFVVIALVSDSAWGIAAGTARSWFGRSPRRVERLGAIGGATMIGLGLQLAISGRRS